MNEMKLNSVDLIYLDRPFNSNRSYNAIYKDKTGMSLPEQVEAFCDIWVLNEERECVITTMPVLMRETGVDDAAAALWKLCDECIKEYTTEITCLSILYDRKIGGNERALKANWIDIFTLRCRWRPVILKNLWILFLGIIF